MDFNKNLKMKVLISVILLASFLYLYPIWTLAITLSGYVIYGVVRAGINLRKIHHLNGKK